MQSTAAPVGPSAGAPTQLDEDLLLLAMQRTWTIAAMQGAFGIDRRRLLELARRTNGRDCTGLAIDALEAGGHLVPLDRERARVALRARANTRDTVATDSLAGRPAPAGTSKTDSAAADSAHTERDQTR